jgi:hypothetical protein
MEAAESAVQRTARMSRARRLVSWRQGVLK